MKAVHLDVPMYGTKVHVCYDRDGWNEIRRIVKPRPGDEALEPWGMATSVAMTFDCDTPDGQHIIMRFNVPPDTKQAGLVGVIAHEAFHAAMSVCAHVGISVFAHGDEAAAYLAQWFADVAWEHRPSGVTI